MIVTIKVSSKPSKNYNTHEVMYEQTFEIQNETKWKEEMTTRNKELQALANFHAINGLNQLNRKLENKK